jgi:hypothetical protein
MKYYGTDDQLAALLQQARRAVAESPTAHWQRSAVRTAAVELARAIEDRYDRVDPQPPGPASAVDTWLADAGTGSGGVFGRQ